MGKRILYVYGTLRPGVEANVRTAPGVMHDLGWFPGVTLEGEGTITVERVVVPESAMAGLDQYEGFYEDSPDGSLFRRVPFLDGEIYVFNQGVTDRKKVVPDGDWLKYTGQTEGRNQHLLCRIEE